MGGTNPLGDTQISPTELESSSPDTLPDMPPPEIAGPSLDAVLQPSSSPVIPGTKAGLVVADDTPKHKARRIVIDVDTPEQLPRLIGIDETQKEEASSRQHIAAAIDSFIDVDELLNGTREPWRPSTTSKCQDMDERLFKHAIHARLQTSCG